MEALRAGTRVGEYVIEHELGRGGMSVVYAASHPIIGKRAAIKVVRTVLCADSTGMLRAIQEARAINRIRHPSVVDVYGWGRLPDGRCYLIMERLEGETLHERMGRRPIAFNEGLDILLSLCGALEAAHAGGIVHRDVKPANVFLTDDGRVKLLDFGLAKLLGDECGITQEGVVLGTPDYISPEQAQGAVVGSRADVYALGVVAFEMLSGQLPFSAADAAVLLRRHKEDEAPRLRALRPEMPAVLDELVAAMLEKDPARRPNVPSVRQALLELSAPARARPQRKIWAAVMALSLFLGAGALASRMQRTRPPPPVAKPTPLTTPRVTRPAPVAVARIAETPRPRPKHKRKRRNADDSLIDPFR
jgi:serine/threonine-protein kinase